METVVWKLVSMHFLLPTDVHNERGIRWRRKYHFVNYEGVGTGAGAGKGHFWTGCPEAGTGQPEPEEILEDGDEIINLGDEREHILSEMKKSLEGEQEISEQELAFSIADHYISIQEVDVGMIIRLWVRTIRK